MKPMKSEMQKYKNTTLNKKQIESNTENSL